MKWWCLHAIGSGLDWFPVKYDKCKKHRKNPLLICQVVMNNNETWICEWYHEIKYLDDISLSFRFYFGFNILCMYVCQFVLMWKPKNDTIRVSNFVGILLVDKYFQYLLAIILYTAFRVIWNYKEKCQIKNVKFWLNEKNQTGTALWSQNHIVHN